MTATLQKTGRLASRSDETTQLRSIAIFVEGEHRGKKYTSVDLNSMVDNFQKFSTGPRALVEPPLVIGHEEDQSWTGIPSMGWVRRLYRRGPTLYADFEGVPRQLADLIRAGRYRHVSAEVYDKPPDGVPGSGRMLRRVALLGGDLPQIKSLADVTALDEFSEYDKSKPRACRFAAARKLTRLTPTRAVRLRAGAWAVFNEVTPMDEQALLDALAAHGADVSILQGVPAPALQEMVRLCDEKSNPEPHPMDMDEGWQTPEEEEKKEEMRERARKYVERARKYAESCGAMDTATMGLVKPGKPETEKMSERSFNAAVEAAVAKIKGEFQGSMNELHRFREEQISTQKKATVDAFVEQVSREGRLPPAEREAERQLLMALDASVVHKFTEGGRTVERSLFDQRIAQIKGRPTMFAEKFKAGNGKTNGNGTASEDGEAEKVEAHYEQFSEQFRRMATTKEEFVGAFKARKKTNEALTAEQFLAGKS